MKATWESKEKLTILSAKMAEIAYPVDADYKDDSNVILKVLQVEEEDDDDEEEAEENFALNVSMLNGCSFSLGSSVEFKLYLISIGRIGCRLYIRKNVEYFVDECILTL